MVKLLLHFFEAIVGKHTGRHRLLHPAILHLTVTNRCSLECRMCNVWKEKPKADIAPEVIEALVSSPYFRDFQIVEYGGGEPFLADLPGITRRLLHPGLKMLLVTTNGWSTERVVEQTGQLLETGAFSLILNVSIDGEAATHDRLRGVAGCHQKAMRTLARLAEMARDRKRLKVGLKFTILPENCAEIWAAYQEAKKLGVEFTAKPAAVFGSLHNEEMNFSFTPEQLEQITRDLKKIDQEQKRIFSGGGVSLFGRLYFFSNLIFNELQLDYLRKNLLEGEARQIIPCFSSFFSIMVHVDGGVYCCPTLMKKVGTIPDEKFGEIWQGEKMDSIRSFIHQGGCSCFSQCDQMPSLAAKYRTRLAWEIMKSLIRGRPRRA